MIAAEGILAIIDGIARRFVNNDKNDRLVYQPMRAMTAQTSQTSQSSQTSISSTSSHSGHESPASSISSIDDDTALSNALQPTLITSLHQNH